MLHNWFNKEALHFCYHLLFYLHNALNLFHLSQSFMHLNWYWNAVDSTMQNPYSDLTPATFQNICLGRWATSMHAKFSCVASTFSVACKVAFFFFTIAQWKVSISDNHPVIPRATHCTLCLKPQCCACLHHYLLTVEQCAGHFISFSL